MEMHIDSMKDGLRPVRSERVYTMAMFKKDLMGSEMNIESADGLSRRSKTLGMKDDMATPPRGTLTARLNSLTGF
jgi:hypothetical protein